VSDADLLGGGGGDELPELIRARATRVQRIKLSVFSALVTKPLAVIIPFVTVPLFLNYLGTTRYGLYGSIGALAAWLALTNIGLGLGLVNKLTDTHVSGDRELARRYVSTIMVAVIAITILGIAILSIVTPLLNWGRIFPTDDPVALREAPWAFWACGVAVFVGFIGSLPTNVYFGYQESHRNNIWDGAAKLATLIASLLVVKTNFGLVGVCVAVALVPGVVRLINTLDMFAREKRWLLPHPRLFDRTLLRVLLVESVSLFILHTAAVGIFQVDKVVIGSVLGPEHVTGFDVVGRLFLIVFGVFTMLLAPLWPAYGEAFRRDDYRWIKKTVRLSSFLGCGATIGFGVVMFFFGDVILRLWTRGQHIEISKVLIAGITAAFAARAWVECRTIVLIGAGYLVPQMYFLAANAILNIALAIMFAKQWGVDGVAWAVPVSTLLTSAWGYPLMISRCIRMKQAAATAGAGSAAEAGVAPAAS
jgi:O-antigen/teichoic acid export membrane protein